MSEVVVDLFAGPGGWDVAARGLGLDPLGIELDRATCETRRAGGLLTLHRDVREAFIPKPGTLTGLIASPPCPEFSSANGRRRGLSSPSGALVHEVMRWVRHSEPEWVACEQVPAVLPIWRHFAARLEPLGYKVAVGLVDAANYGLPQNRERAVLLASRALAPTIPAATHADGGGGMFADVEPWATLADTLGLEPGWSYDSGQNSAAAGGGKARYVRSCDRPAGTLTGQTRGQWVLTKGDQRRKLTFAEACRLQGFPEDYPFCGKADERDQQLGNAVPPPLAGHLLTAVTGLSVAAATEGAA